MVLGVGDLIMKSYRKELWFDVKNRREFVNITPVVEDCLAESGIKGPGDIERLQNAGYDGFLIGEHLVRAQDPVGALRRLRIGVDEG